MRYFGKAGKLALLVGVSVFTYGIGGLVYYARCRRRLICPRCALGWEMSQAVGGPQPTDPQSIESLERAPAPPVPGGQTPAASAPRSVAPPRSDRALPRRGVGRRVSGAVMGILGTLMIAAGIAGGGDGPPIVMGAFFGMTGTGLFAWGWRSLQERRRAVLRTLNRKVLRLAARRSGVLTVTDVAAELDLSLDAADKLLMGLDDGFRVRSDISDEGVIYYEFPEVIHQKALRAGKPSTEPRES